MLNPSVLQTAVEAGADRPHSPAQPPSKQYSTRPLLLLVPLTSLTAPVVHSDSVNNNNNNNNNNNSNNSS